jgi:hypothetical protein
MGSSGNKGASRKNGMWLGVCALSEKLKTNPSRKFFAPAKK